MTADYRARTRIEDLLKHVVPDRITREELADRILTETQSLQPNDRANADHGTLAFERHAD